VTRVVGTLVSDSVAREIARALARSMREAVRRDGETFSPEAWNALDELVAAARGDVVTPIANAVVAGVTADRVDVSGGITVSATAALRGCSRQAVLMRLSRGTLQGHKDDQGRWLVDLEGAK
jgi:hypothetical protein